MNNQKKQRQLQKMKNSKKPQLIKDMKNKKIWLQKMKNNPILTNYLLLFYYLNFKLNQLGNYLKKI